MPLILLDNYKGAAPPPATDPYWDNVEFLLRAGVDSLIDMKGHALTLPATVYAEDPLAPQGSLVVASSGLVIGAPALGTADYTLEMSMAFSSIDQGYLWANVSSTAGGLRHGFSTFAGQSNAYAFTNGGGSGNAANWILSPVALAAVGTSWHHYAISRVSGVTRLFYDGTKVAETAAVFNFTQVNYWIGLNMGNPNHKWQEARMTLGVGRYVADFVSPTTLFPSTGP